MSDSVMAALGRASGEGPSRRSAPAPRQPSGGRPTGWSRRGGFYGRGVFRRHGDRRARPHGARRRRGMSVETARRTGRRRQVVPEPPGARWARLDSALPRVNHERVVPLTVAPGRAALDAIGDRYRALVVAQADLGLRIGSCSASAWGDWDAGMVGSLPASCCRQGEAPGRHQTAQLAAITTLRCCWPLVSRWWRNAERLGHDTSKLVLDTSATFSPTAMSHPASHRRGVGHVAASPVHSATAQGRPE